MEQYNGLLMVLSLLMLLYAIFKTTEVFSFFSPLLFVVVCVFSLNASCSFFPEHNKVLKTSLTQFSPNHSAKMTKDSQSGDRYQISPKALF